MQWLAALCVRRPVFASVLVLTLTVVGAFGYSQLGVDRFPKVDFPTIMVTTRQPGAAPEQIETEITDKIEEAVNTISGLDELRSTSAEGVSIVTASFLLEKDVDVAAQEVRDKVNRILPQLPRTILQPIIEKMDTDAAPVLGLAVSAPRPVREITEYADKVLRRRLETVSGVGQVLVLGGRGRQINVLARPRSPARLQRHGDRRVPGAAGAERRDSRRAARAGAAEPDAPHAGARPVGRAVRRDRRARPRRAMRSRWPTWRRSRTAWRTPPRSPT